MLYQMMEFLKSIDMEDGSQDWSYNLGTKVTVYLSLQIILYL